MNLTLDNTTLHLTVLNRTMMDIILKSSNAIGWTIDGKEEKDGCVTYTIFITMRVGKPLRITITLLNEDKLLQEYNTRQKISESYDSDARLTILFETKVIHHS